jgi:hypothetical protein
VFDFSLSVHERHQKGKSSLQNLSGLLKTFFLAKKMGEKLG